jgi:DNA-directed RNA polymerase specialized sigma24 family protein
MLENYYRELVCFLNAKLGNRQIAEDVVHDAYLRVLERSSDTPIEQPRAFLYRTALNLVIDDHRRNALRQVESLDVLDNEERYFTPSPTTLSITASVWKCSSARWQNCRRCVATVFCCARSKACRTRKSPNSWAFPRRWWKNTSSMR